MPRSKKDLDEWHGRGDASRARILEVAQRLFVRNGFAATPVSQIAREAGVTIPPVYYHFVNKLGLFKAVVETAGGQIERDIEGLSPVPLRDGLVRLVDRALASADAHIAGLRCRLLVSFQQDDDAGELIDIMRRQREQSIDLMIAFFKDALDPDDPRRDQRCRLLASLYISGLQHFCLDLMSTGESLLPLRKALFIDSLVSVAQARDLPAEAD